MTRGRAQNWPDGRQNGTLRKNGALPKWRPFEMAPFQNGAPSKIAPFATSSLDFGARKNGKAPQNGAEWRQNGTEGRPMGDKMAPFGTNDALPKWRPSKMAPFLNG